MSFLIVTTTKSYTHKQFAFSLRLRDFGGPFYLQIVILEIAVDTQGLPHAIYVILFLC
jgi:hypothetical protein